MLDEEGARTTHQVQETITQMRASALDHRGRNRGVEGARHIACPPGAGSKRTRREAGENLQPCFLAGRIRNSKSALSE